jgi:hypothetical protein
MSSNSILQSHTNNELQMDETIVTANPVDTYAPPIILPKAVQAARTRRKAAIGDIRTLDPNYSDGDSRWVLPQTRYTHTRECYMTNTHHFSAISAMAAEQQEGSFIHRQLSTAHMHRAAAVKVAAEHANRRTTLAVHMDEGEEDGNEFELGEQVRQFCVFLFYRM